MARKTPDTPMKRCTKTGEVLPMTPEFFYRDKSSKDGFSPWSKLAEKAYNRAYYDGLKQAKVTRKGDIPAGAKGAKGRKAYEESLTPERVKRGTHRSKVVTETPETPKAAPKARTSTRQAKAATPRKATSRTTRQTKKA